MHNIAQKDSRVIILSGRSGSGKSITLHLLEDIGYYCLDNLPVTLIPLLFEQLKDNYPKIAIGIDIRNIPREPEAIYNILKIFEEKKTNCEIIFLDAEDATLLKRFNETRRKHPLSSKTLSLSEAIVEEKRILDPLAHMADLKIDTTHYSIHELRDLIKSRIDRKKEGLSLQLLSFGYKFGVPVDSDFVFDVRCLPNPYWHQELRNFTGKDKAITRFLDNIPEAQRLYKNILSFLVTWLPQFEANNRCYMSIAIGCTGGQHRSVYFVEKLFQDLHLTRSNVQLRHREL